MFRLALHWQIMIAMVIGATIGVTLNFTVGTAETEQIYYGGRLQPYGLAQPVAVQPGVLWVLDSPDGIQIETFQRTADQPNRITARRYFAGMLSKPEDLEKLSWPEKPKYLPPLPGEATASTTELPAGAQVEVAQTVARPSLDELKKTNPEAYVLFQQYGRSWSRAIGDRARMAGNLFLRMLQMVSVPLIIVSLISGVMGVGQAERLGKMFGRTFAYYICTSIIAITIGIMMMNLMRPGASGDAPVAAAQSNFEEGKQLGTILFEQVENLIPTNPIAAIASSEFLSIIAFSLLFAVFALMVGGKAADTVRDLAQVGFDVMMKMTMFIIMLAPFGVLFLMLFATATQGIGIFGRLGMYMITVALGLLIHGAVVMPLILKFVARRSPLEYARALSPALFMAFSSSSSNATLPVTLTCVEKRAGISNRVSSFVLPLGATVNMDGTALYEAAAVLFIAQWTGHDLSLAQQIVVAITALLASIGAAGIPQAGLVMMIVILQAVGLPIEAQGLIIAVDRILDMMRTVVNIWSDACGAAVVARFEADDPSEPSEPPSTPIPRIEGEAP